MSAILRVEQLNMVFGGVHAVADLSFEVSRGSIHSVIGPNGAGKTTLFNMISGVYRPGSGKIFLQDADITGQSPHRLAAAGMSRSFQNLQIFMNMSAVENIMVGRHLHLDRSLWKAMLRLPVITRNDRAARDHALALLAFAGLEAYRDSDANAMPYGALKRLEIARALATEPQLLLLDEPAAGLNPSETAEIDALIQRVAADGVTVLLVEHDMKLVMQISQHILVLDHGRRLAEGSPAEIRRDPAVIRAYLGAA